MKICMFTNTYLPHVGGVARSVHFFTEDLRARGHQVLVVAPIFSEDVDDEREDEVLRVPAIQNFNGSDFSVRITLPFIISNKINEFQPDLIHSHHPFLLGDAALRTARRQECPLVFTHHTLYERYTHYVPFDSEGLRRFVIHLSIRYANLCCGVVAPSRSIVDLLRERGVTTAIREIPTGVDLAFFESGRGGRFRSAHKIPEGKPVVGHVGRLAPEKNLGYLARAVAKFLTKHDGCFLVVGEGPSREEIEGIFETEGLSSRLYMAGEQTGRELADAYRAMDVFVFASKTETQGMVLVEAMAAENPVIALDASGVREVIRDDLNGRLLREDAQEAIFVQALEEFFNDFDRAAAWREGALETARRFSREECANRLLHFYEQLLEKYAGGIAESGEPNEEILSWEKMLRSLKVEWDLISQKAGALTEAFNEDENP